MGVFYIKTSDVNDYQPYTIVYEPLHIQLNSGNNDNLVDDSIKPRPPVVKHQVSLFFILMVVILGSVILFSLYFFCFRRRKLTLLADQKYQFDVQEIQNDQKKVQVFEDKKEPGYAIDD